MRLRYAGACSVCDVDLPAGQKAIYDRLAKTVRCVGCLPETGALADPVAVDVRDHVQEPPRHELPRHEETAQTAEAGTAGSSARREYERRKARREDRIRTQHPKLGGLILALSDDPQSTRAWEQGAVGEERLGARLDQLDSAGVATLHDRRIPGTCANIDHIVIGPTGVWVIDAKRYKGRPTLRVEGGILRPRVERLLVGRRDCTKLVDGVLKQVGLLRDALSGEEHPPEVIGALAFVDADWPMIGGSFTTRRVHVVWPKRLQRLLLAAGPVQDVAGTHRTLSKRFPPA
jgi:hypothetical protein